MNFEVQNTPPLNILLADDDTDDCIFFYKALKEIPIATHLATFHDGEELMNHLSFNSDHLPDLLFLDLSMPRKTGFECLDEIKENIKLKSLPIIIFSIPYNRGINYEHDMIKLLLNNGVHKYITKTTDFDQLKKAIQILLIQATEKKLLIG